MHRVLQVVRLLERRDGRVDHLLGELDVLLVERRVAVGGAEEEDPRRLLPQREPERDGRAGRAPAALASQTARIPWNSGSVRTSRTSTDLAGGERLLDLGIPAEVHRQVVQHRVLERGHHRSVVVVRTGDDDRAAGDVEPLGHPPHQDLVDLLRLEGGGDLLEDLHHLRPRARLRPGLVQLAADAQVRLDPGQQLAHPERLGDEVGRAEAEGADGGFLGRHRGDHEDRQVLEPRIGLDPLQELQAVHLGHHDVEQQQVELLGLRWSKRCSPPGTVSTS